MVLLWFINKVYADLNICVHRALLMLASHHKLASFEGSMKAALLLDVAQHMVILLSPCCRLMSPFCGHGTLVSQNDRKRKLKSPSYGASGKSYPELKENNVLQNRLKVNYSSRKTDKCESEGAKTVYTYVTCFKPIL